jgi:hypothetical protein
MKDVVENRVIMKEERPQIATIEITLIASPA